MCQPRLTRLLDWCTQKDRKLWIDLTPILSSPQFLLSANDSHFCNLIAQGQFILYHFTAQNKLMTESHLCLSFGSEIDFMRRCSQAHSHPRSLPEASYNFWTLIPFKTLCVTATPIRHALSLSYSMLTWDHCKSYQLHNKMGTRIAHHIFSSPKRFKCSSVPTRPLWRKVIRKTGIKSWFNSIKHLKSYTTLSPQISSCCWWCQKIGGVISTYLLELSSVRQFLVWS